MTQLKSAQIVLIINHYAAAVCNFLARRPSSCIPAPNDSAIATDKPPRSPPQVGTATALRSNLILYLDKKTRKKLFEKHYFHSENLS
jgi:hypothetical protein